MYTIVYVTDKDCEVRWREKIVWGKPELQKCVREVRRNGSGMDSDVVWPE
jgi:hypothetical protein